MVSGVSCGPCWKELDTLPGRSQIECAVMCQRRTTCEKYSYDGEGLCKLLAGCGGLQQSQASTHMQQAQQVESIVSIIYII